MRGFARIRYPPVGRDRYLASVAQSRCCVDPVTLLPLHVDPMQAPVFGERAVFRSGDAPKAPRSEKRSASLTASLRLEKGIR